MRFQVRWALERSAIHREPAGARQAGQGLACKRDKSASLPDLIMTIIRDSREFLKGVRESACSASVLRVAPCSADRTVPQCPYSVTLVRSMYVAFLRGLNVGGRNRIAMADLSAVFETSGARSVRTYIQSGNVMFEAPELEVRRVLAAVEDQLEARLGSKVAVAARSGSHLRAIAADHPFGSIATDPRQLHVGFLRGRPSPEIVARLDPDRSPPDRMVVRGAEIFFAAAERSGPQQAVQCILRVRPGHSKHIPQLAYGARTCQDDRP